MENRERWDLWQADPCPMDQREETEEEDEESED